MPVVTHRMGSFSTCGSKVIRCPEHTKVAWGSGAYLEITVAETNEGWTVEIWYWESIASIRDMKSINIPKHIQALEGFGAIFFWQGWRAAIGALLAMHLFESTLTLHGSDMFPTPSKSPFKLKAVQNTRPDSVDLAWRVAEALMKPSRLPGMWAQVCSANCCPPELGILPCEVPVAQRVEATLAESVDADEEPTPVVTVVPIVDKRAASVARKEKARQKKLKRRAARKRSKAS